MVERIRLSWCLYALSRLPRLCWCGRHGCIETWLSGVGLARDHERVTAERLFGEAISRLAAATLSRYEERLARALAHVINLFDPDVIVLGGAVSRVEHLYRTVPALWEQWMFSDRVDTKLVPALHGDFSGVRGAAFLCPPDPAAALTVKALMELPGLAVAGNGAGTPLAHAVLRIGDIGSL